MMPAMRTTATANQRMQVFVPVVLLLIALSWSLYRQWPQPMALEVIEVPVDPDCDLRAGPCETRLANDAVLRFAIEPRDIPLMQPLTMLVEVSGMQPEQVVVVTNGVDMDMGFNRVTLKKIGVSHFRGTADLSYCTRYAMQWQSVVELRAANRVYRAPFQFITVKDAAALREGY